MVKDYIQKTYSGWLGKIIGIRMGAPIENWSKEKIELFFGTTLRDYPVDYQDFAADDDSNGPLFFVRGLEHHKRLTSEAMATTCLNYIPREHGFFWWGGELSTEHTSFKNLYAGIKAPESGSAKQNGMEMAEQIGGQIFIDGFGFVAPGNPELACELAEASARVTHDYDGVAGARFIAACISLAYVKFDLLTIMKEALMYIDGTGNYYKVITEMIACYESGKSWEEAFALLQNEYWTDCYGGVCHIIPNAGIIAIALLYGQGDFLDTMELVNRLGFDTDCNAGNIGAIMGVLTNEIPEHLIHPIKDVLLASSVVGSLNITTISESTLLFCKLGYELAGRTMPEPYHQYWYALEKEGKRISHFEFPHAIHGFRTKASYKNAEVKLQNVKGSCKITVNNLHPGGEISVYQKTYYQPEDLHDARYQPSFSPIAYPGDEVTCMLVNATGQKLIASLYVYDCMQNQRHRFAEISLREGTCELSGRIPHMADAMIKEVGVILESAEETDTYFGEQVVVCMKEFVLQGNPDYSMDFSKAKWENYTLHNVEQYELAGFTHYLADYDGIELQEYGVRLSKGEAVYTGDYYWRDYQYEVVVSHLCGSYADILFRCQGNLRYYAVRLQSDCIRLIKSTEQGIETLMSVTCSIAAEEIPVHVSVSGDTIQIEAAGKFLKVHDSEYSHGLVGMRAGEDSSVILHQYRIGR